MATEEEVPRGVKGISRLKSARGKTYWAPGGESTLPILKILTTTWGDHRRGSKEKDRPRWKKGAKAAPASRDVGSKNSPKLQPQADAGGDPLPKMKEKQAEPPWGVEKESQRGNSPFSSGRTFPLRGKRESRKGRAVLSIERDIGRELPPRKS